MTTLDSPACAALLNCSVAHLQRLARNGTIPGAKIGKDWVFIEADVLDWLRQKSQPKIVHVAQPKKLGRPRKIVIPS